MEEKDQLPELDPVRDNATADDFKTKNKVYELLLYTGPELEQFPRAQRRLADEKLTYCGTLYGLQQTRNIHAAGSHACRCGSMRTFPGR